MSVLVDMALRFNIQASMALITGLLHCAIYATYFMMYQILNTVELACWYIDTSIEEHLRAHPSSAELPPGSTVPAKYKVPNLIVRRLWSYIMWTICILHVSHKKYCAPSGHFLPNEVTYLAQYYHDHAQTGPCADFNNN